jgi:hypothetical protein
MTTVPRLKVFTAVPGKKEYDYDLPESDPPGDAGLARQRARVVRSDASGVLNRETARILRDA